MNRLNLASSFFSLFVLFFLNGCGPQKLPSSAGLDQWLMHETIVYENKELSPEIYEEKASITVDLTQQLVTLYLGGEKVMVARTSTGIRTNTPVGSFRVTEKVESGKVSNVYGKIYDSNDEYVYLGNRSFYDGEVSRFEGVEIPFWMRLTGDGIGIHLSKSIYKYPASGGCIRLSPYCAEYFFKHAKVGTPVRIF